MKLLGSTKTKVALIALVGAAVCVTAAGLTLNHSAFSLIQPGGVAGCLVMETAVDRAADAVDRAIDAEFPDPPDLPEAPEAPTAPASPIATDWALGDFEVDASQVAAIELNWLAGKVNVRVVPDKETGGTIRATETLRPRSPQMQWELSSSGVLSINYMDGVQGFSGLAGCSSAFADSKELELLIPESLQADLKRFELEAASGEYSIDGAERGVLCSTLELGVASGSVYVNNVTVDSLEVSLASGRISFGGDVAQTLSLDQASGEFTLGGCSAPPESIAGSLASGRIVLELPADTALAARVDKTSGSFRNDFENVQGGEGATCNLDFEIMSGSLDVVKAS